MKRKNLDPAVAAEAQLSDIENAAYAATGPSTADVKIVVRDEDQISNEWTIFIPNEDLPELLGFLKQFYSKRLTKLGIEL